MVWALDKFLELRYASDYMWEAVVRDNHNITSRRDVVVSQPLKVTEVGRQEKRDITVPDFPNSQTRGTHDQSSISISH